MKHRVGIIGAGDIAQKTYIPLLSERKDCQIVGIYSRTKAPAAKLAKEFQIDHVFDDIDELFEHKEIDSVFVCTPTETHARIATAALHHSKNVLIEKPLTTIYDDDIKIPRYEADGMTPIYLTRRDNQLDPITGDNHYFIDYNDYQNNPSNYSYNLDYVSNGIEDGFIDPGDYEGYKIIKTGAALQFMEYWMLGLSFSF